MIETEPDRIIISNENKFSGHLDFARNVCATLFLLLGLGLFLVYSTSPEKLDAEKGLISISILGVLGTLWGFFALFKTRNPLRFYRLDKTNKTLEVARKKKGEPQLTLSLVNIDSILIEAIKDPPLMPREFLDSGFFLDKESEYKYFLKIEMKDWDTLDPKDYKMLFNDWKKAKAAADTIAKAAEAKVFDKTEEMRRKSVSYLPIP